MESITRLQLRGSFRFFLVEYGIPLEIFEDSEACAEIMNGDHRLLPHIDVLSISINPGAHMSLKTAE